MSEAKQAIIRMLRQGPDFAIPESMAGNAASNGAKVQYAAWIAGVIPLIEELWRDQGISAGGAYIGNASAGRDVVGGDSNSGAP